MKKFRTWYDAKIDEVEVIRETAKFVVLASDNRRWMKRSEDHWNFFDTCQEARQFLIDREKDAIREHQNDITRHQEALQKIEAMQS